MEVNRREIFRYMGVRGEADPRTEELVESCIAELTACQRPRSFSLEFPLRVSGDGTVDMQFLRTKSRNLARNLRGCDRIIVFAATIGSGADLLIRRYSKTTVARGLAMQATAAAMIEAYCNEVNEAFREEAARRGYYLRPRFSPGYGDFPLGCQREILDVLKAEKTVGITLTESLLMMPSKSVSAVIGMSREKTPCLLEGCEVCDKKDCEFRR